MLRAGAGAGAGAGRCSLANRRSPVAGRRSPVAGRWSPVAGRRSPVAGRRSMLALRAVVGRASGLRYALDAASAAAAGLPFPVVYRKPAVLLRRSVGVVVPLLSLESRR